MVPGGLTKRYSKALFDLCGDAKERTSALEALKRFLAVYEESAELREVVRNPAFAFGEKQATLSDIYSSLKLPQTMINFLSFLLERQRLDCVAGICADFEQRLDGELGRVRVEITSAVELSPADKKRAESALQKLTGSKEIVVECKVDPLVIGGVVTRIGNTVFDSSIRSQIDNMREHLLAG